MFGKKNNRYEIRENEKWWAQGAPKFGVWDTIYKQWVLEKKRKNVCRSWIKANSGKHCKK